MAEITKIKCNDVEYDIKDETARSSVTSLQSSVGTLTTRVNALETGGTGGAGPKGDKGDDGVTFIPSVSEAGVISWTNNGGLNNPESVNIKGAKGDNGINGTDGVSPTVTVSKSGKVTTVTITDKNGEHVATINDGADGTGSGGSGDMTKAIYDTDEDGIVDNASKLGGQLPAYYAKASDLSGKVDAVSGKGLSSNDYTTTEKEKLAGIEEGAQKNVQSDWNATSGDALIKNKPTIPTVPTTVSSFTNDAGYLTSYTETDPTVPAWAKAESKPTYTATEVGAEASGAVSTHNTSSSAQSTLFSGKQNKITATGLLKGTSSGVVAATAGTDYAAASHTHVAANVTGLATVATSGKYSDLTEKPTIPTIYAYTVSLTAAGWSDKSQTVTAAHVTANNLVQVSPAESSFEAWQTAQIRCTAQGAGTLTFVCGGDAPTDAVTYNVVVTDGVTA